MHGKATEFMGVPDLIFNRCALEKIHRDESLQAADTQTLHSLSLILFGLKS
jgi:hypothetical protein